MNALVHEAELLASKIKSLEQVNFHFLSACMPFVVRLDGVSFKRFTSRLGKPFDPRFTKAILRTARDLLDRSAARTAFCQSDEITLVFGPEESYSTMFYGGRVSKVESVLASMAAARFNFHLGSVQDWTEEPAVNNEDVIQSTRQGNAFFDARAFSVPDTVTAGEAVYWRHKHDLRRNAVNTVGFHLLGHKALAGASMNSVLQVLMQEHGVDPFKSYPKAAVWGAFLKKAQYDGVGFNPKTGVTVSCTRSRVEARTFDWDGTPEERAEMVLDRFWCPEHPSSAELLDL